MTNNKKSKQLPGNQGITVTPIVIGKQAALEFANKGGAKAVFVIPLSSAIAWAQDRTGAKRD